MTAICKCDGFPLALPLELENRFYCGSCGGMYEGKRAAMAKDMWETTGRINLSIMSVRNELEREATCTAYQNGKEHTCQRKTRVNLAITRWPNG